MKQVICLLILAYFLTLSTDTQAFKIKIKGKGGVTQGGGADPKVCPEKAKATCAIIEGNFWDVIKLKFRVSNPQLQHPHTLPFRSDGPVCSLTDLSSGKQYKVRVQGIYTTDDRSIEGQEEIELDPNRIKLVFIK